MTKTSYKIYETKYPYFITLTAFQWTPIFNYDEPCDIIIDSLKYMISNERLKIYGYVVMIDHIHLIVQNEKLKHEITKLKSFTARKIVDWAISSNQIHLLDNLKYTKEDDRNYKIWEPGFKPIQISNAEVMKTKIRYIHHNPVKKGFVKKPEDWLRSSASNYSGEVGLVDIVVDW